MQNLASFKYTITFKLRCVALSGLVANRRIFQLEDPKVQIPIETLFYPLKLLPILNQGQSCLQKIVFVKCFCIMASSSVNQRQPPKHPIPLKSHVFTAKLMLSRLDSICTVLIN